MSNSASSTLNIPKSIHFLSTELKANTQELVRLKSSILTAKTNYKLKITEYNSILSDVFSQEAAIEDLNSQMSKLKQKISLSLYHLSSPAYFSNLQDSSKNPDSSKLANLIFLFLSPTQSELDFSYSAYFLFIPKDSDFRELLDYALIIQSNLYRSSRDVFDKIKRAIVNEQTKHYPFDVLFEYFSHIYHIISIEEEIQLKMQKHDEENMKKNSVFIEIKRLEREVNSNDCLYRKIDRNVQEVNVLLSNYKTINSNSKGNKAKLYKDFFQSIKDYHPISERSGISKNYMTTLTINSEVNGANWNAKINGDTNQEPIFNGKKKKNSKQNSMYSNSSFKTASNKKFLSSFAEILPDQPETEVNKLITMIQGEKPFERAVRNTNQCSTIESQRELLDEEDFAGLPVDYSLNDYKESVCEELSTYIFSVRATSIGYNSNLRPNKLSKAAINSKAQQKVLLYNTSFNCSCLE